MPVNNILARQAASQSASYTQGGGDNGWWPDFLPQFGGTTLLKELSSIPSGLIRLAASAAPGGVKSQLPTAGRAILGSALGTVSTIAKPFGIPGTEWNLGDKIIEPLGEQALGEQFKPQDFFEKARDRGILPALVEDVGNVALGAGAVKGLATKGAAAAAEGGNAARAAELTARASKLEPFAHPYVFTGEKLADLAIAAKRATNPVTTVAEGIGKTPLETLDDVDQAPTPESIQANTEARQSLIEAQNVTKAAAGTIQARAGARELIDDTVTEGLSSERAVADAGQGRPGRALNQEALREHNSTLPEPEPTVTLYRDAEGGRWVEDAKQSTPDPEGVRYKVEVPKSQWTGDGQLPEKWEKVPEAVDGPDTPTVRQREKGKSRVTDAESDTLRAAEASARAEFPVPETVRAAAARVEPGAWAVRAVDKLPDVAKRTLAAFEGPVTKSRIRRVERELSRHIRIAQSMARSSEAVQASTKIAEDLLRALPELDRFDVSRMIGQEMAARLDGTDFIEAMVRSGGGKPETQATLRSMARRGFDGVPDEIKARLGDQWEPIDAAINSAVDAWKAERGYALRQLVASSKGTKGLEHAILETDSPILTRAQLRKYNKAMHDMRVAEKLRKRGVDERARVGAERARNKALQEITGKRIGKAQGRLKEASVRASELRKPPVPGVKLLDQAIDGVLEGLAANGGDGVTFNPQTGAVVNRTDGFSVGIGDGLGEKQALFDVDEATFAANHRTLIGDQLTANMDAWYNPAANFGLWRYTDGNGMTRYAADISLVVESRAEAVLIGEAFKQDAIYAFGAGDISLSQVPQVQAVAAHYLDDALNPGTSPVMRVWREIEAAAPNMDVAEIDDAMRVWMHYDYALHRTGHELRTFFKNAKVDTGVRLPSADYLAQTVLNMSTDEAVAQALNGLTPQTVSDALAWYYDSHDYVESMWRYNEDGSVRMMTLLDGTERPAADVFYDLLAVTSVMASPTQNLGRALLGVAQHSEFMASNKNAMAAAKALMRKVEELSKNPSVVVREVLDADGKLKSQKVSSVFDELPELRALSAQTSMVYSPMENVLDVLMGRVNLETATLDDLDRAPGNWRLNEKTGKPARRGLSYGSIPRSEIVDQLPPDHPYVEWHRRQTEFDDLANRRKALAEEGGVSPAVAFKLLGSEFPNNSAFDKARTAHAKTEADFIDDVVAPIRENVAMEYYGSKALAKLRSFRENLANPHESMAVTLDSVMARLYGIDSTDWTGGNTYGRFAKDVRSAAEELSVKFGRDVKPHEVQALLWVFAKLEVGRQDWGRLLYHHDYAVGGFDQLVGTDLRNWDPLADYWEETLGYSREALPVRQERSDLIRRRADLRKVGGDLTPEEAERLAWLREQDVSSPRGKPAVFAEDRADLYELPDDANYSWGERQSIPFDAKKLANQEERYGKWLDELTKIRADLAAGDVTAAKQRMTQWLASQRRGVQGDAGGSFQVVGEQTRAAPEAGKQPSSAYLAETRHNAIRRSPKRLPPPNKWMSNFVANMSARYNRKFGLPAPQAIDVTKQVIPERTAAIAAHYDALPTSWDDMTPAQQARATESYGALVEHVTQQYRWLTTDPDGPQMRFTFVPETEEYGVGSLAGQGADAAVEAHRLLVEDVRTNNHMKVRSTTLNGDEANQFMSDTLDEFGGITVNDAFRAVHDFFGHTQAGNNFSRHGENIATVLHMQTLPKEAWPALVTELRGQTSALVDSKDIARRAGDRTAEGVFPPQKVAVDWPDEMVQPDYMTRGSLDELHQSFDDRVRGALVMPKGKDARLVVRLFEGGGLDTLVHEGGHLLRQLLGDSDMQVVAKAFPGITDATLTPGRVAAEEAFVASMMSYIRDGKLPPKVKGQATLFGGQLAPLFSRIASVLDEVYGAMSASPYGPTTPDITSFWDRVFMPDVEHPAPLRDPLNRASLPSGIETKRFPFESEAASLRRARQYGEARAAVQVARADLAAHRATLRKLEAADERLRKAMDGVMPSEKAAARLEAGARKKLDSIAGEIVDGKPANEAWQPMYDAWKALRKEAEKSPELADILSEVPETFAEIIQAAVANGFSPTHIRDMGWDAAQAKLFGHVQLGKQGLDTAVEAGTRKARTGALVRSGLADRSIEALAAATVEAAHERLTNAAVTFVEENYARPIAAGQEIPEGWVAWDPERTWVLTGHTPTRDGIQAISGTATKMVPESVKTALRDMGKQYNHWAFNGLTRGPARWWRTWMLTLSPRWYVNNIIGNTMLATTEGVRLRDWMSAWKAYRNGTLPREVVGQAINSFDDIDASTLISRNVRDTLKNEGKKRALEQAHKRLQRGNEVVDELARAAVFERHMRTGASREHAINRAYQALVDYGDLTPIERGLVRSVIPFYAWQKGVFKLLTRFPVDHPMATPVLQQIGLLHMELLEDELGGPIPDAYLGNVPITPGITLNTRPFNALMDAGSLATPEGIAQSIGPFNDIIIRDAYHAPEGPPTGYEIGPTGAAVPNVDVASEFVNTFRALPQVRLGEQVFKGEDVYGQNPGVGDAVSGFAGVPRTYTQEEVQAIIDRLLKAQSRTA